MTLEGLEELRALQHWEAKEFTISAEGVATWKNGNTVDNDMIKRWVEFGFVDDLVLAETKAQREFDVRSTWQLADWTSSAGT